METIKFGAMYDRDIIQYIRDIAAEGSSLKKEIFKNNIMNKEIDKKICDAYLTAVNDFLRFWDDYSKDLQEKIKAAKGTEGVNTISYDYVKEFIYASHDYASVLPFTDGLIKGVNEKKFNSVDDIEDFRDHTLSKAFKIQANSPAALLDSVLTNPGAIGNMNGIHPASKMDAKMFDSIHNYAIFNRRSRPELYKSIEAVIKFMVSDIGIGAQLKNKDPKVYVSMINNIVEYMTYSLTAYATRIYIISAYAYPFISGSTSGKGTIKPLKESGNDEEPGANSMEITVFRDADDMICRDPAKTKEFIDIFSQFTKMAGADHLFGSIKATYQNRWGNIDGIESSTFCSKLMTNELHEFLASRRFDFSLYNDKTRTMMIELNQILKACIYNTTQGIQGTTSPKQEIMHTIRGTTCDNTLKGYQVLAKDLYLFAIHMCCNTEELINQLTSWKSNEQEYPRNNTGTYNTASECLKILSEFYRDLASAITQKARDIEMKINDLRNAAVDKTMSSLKLDIIDKKSETSVNNNLMTAVPDTTRIPTELIDLYDIPSFESMKMYDEYASSLPGMEDDIYYSEAFNISGLIDTIIAKIRSSWERFKAFLNNKDVQAAMKWAIDHEREIAAMDFTGASMHVLPYKVDLNLPKGYDNLKSGLANFDSNKIKTKDDADKFIKSLYPSDAVYGWFTGDKNKDGKYGGAMFRSYILFKDETDANETPPAPVLIDAAKIQKYVPEWIKTIKSANETFNAYKRIGDEIEASIKNIRNKTVNISANNSDIPKMEEDKSNQPPKPAAGSSQGNTAANDQATKAAEAGAATPASTETKPAEQKKEEGNSTADIAGVALNEINLANIRLYNSLSSMFIEYIKNEYKYLKEAYTMGRKKQ